MITAEEQAILDYSINHQIDLSRFSTGQVREVIGLLNAADKDILAKIAKRDPGDGSFTSARLEAMLKDIRGTLDDAYQSAGDQFAGNMKDFAVHEGDSAASMLSGVLPPSLSITSVSDNQLKALIDKIPTQYGADGAFLLEETFAGLAAGKEERIRGAVRLGMMQGETTSEMVRRLQGSRASGYTDGIFEKDRKHAETIVRTEVNAVSNRAASETFKANSNVVKGWRFMATLDGRTSITCASLSGNVYPLEDKEHLPPRHPNCRSFIVPAVKTWKELGFGDQFKEMGAGQRASKDGLVAGDITFDKWLRTQPTDVQVSILGAARQKLFIDGRLPIGKFTDASGEVYTLDELAKRNKKNFDKAFGTGEKAKVEKTEKETVKPEKVKTVYNTISDFFAHGDTLSRYQSRKVAPFEGLKPAQELSILEGLRNSVGDYGGRVAAVGFHGERSAALGLHNYEMQRVDGESKFVAYITLQKTAVKNMSGVVKSNIKAFEDRKAYFIKDYEKTLSGNISGTSRKMMEEKLSTLNSTKRWAVFTDAEDPLKAAIEHEGFHNIYRLHKLEPAFLDSLRSNGIIDNKEWFKVSEYGASKASELFSEVGSAITSKVDIPPAFIKAFNEAVATMGGVM